ncbi:hypothetical protein R5H30_13680 [Sulfitobacter sp. D35]|uniref:hypothetical protein n=1 Tax=Sulfitobacter sp. D35 TaxID=3083252 RepID=UPI00296F2845|nr:hypothetical protein [Sulfitobacter sp. D35]MDW4499041.1 hypothetical protein [Sulfitobacter sp. D35]
MTRALLVLCCALLAACDGTPSAPAARSPSTATADSDRSTGVNFSGYTRFGVKRTF